MKTKLLFILFVIITNTFPALAQSTRVGAHDAVTNWTPSSTNSFTHSDVKQVIDKILNAVGAKANFIVQPANIQNAAAVTYGGKRYIIYSPGFMKDLADKSGTEWGPISVLAHEVGHHINPPKQGATQQQLELIADEFSGFALRRMGATVLEAQAAMMTLANARATRTHPGQDDRLIAIENGWMKAESQIMGIAYTPKLFSSTQNSTPAIASRSASGTALNTSAILGQVIFDAAPNSKFFITKNFQLVQQRNNRISTIGKMTALNSSEYPFMIYDESNTRLLVDKKGNILTRSGRQVGLLKAFNQ